MTEDREFILNLALHFQNRSQDKSSIDKREMLLEQSECLKRFVAEFDDNKKRQMLGMK